MPEQFLPVPPVLYPTGIPNWDSRLSGFPKGEITAIHGGEVVGKLSVPHMMMFVAKGLASRGFDVAWFDIPWKHPIEMESFFVPRRNEEDRGLVDCIQSTRDVVFIVRLVGDTSEEVSRRVRLIYNQTTRKPRREQPAIVLLNSSKYRIVEQHAALSLGVDSSPTLNGCTIRIRKNREPPSMTGFDVTRFFIPLSQYDTEVTAPIKGFWDRLIEGIGV